MARSYSAREGLSSKSPQAAGGDWHLLPQINSDLEESKRRVEKLTEEMEDNIANGYRNGRSYTIELNKAKRMVEFYNGIKETLGRLDELRRGDASAFEPPVKRPSKDWVQQAQLALYELAVANGVSTGKKFSEDRLDEIFEKYGKSQKRETAFWWDSENRLVSAITGTKDEVGQSLLISHTNLKPVFGGTSWHNHPTEDGRVWGFPPSSADVKSMVSRLEKTAYVGAKEGVYKMVLTPEKMEELSKLSATEASNMGLRMKNEWQGVWNVVKSEMRKALEKRKETLGLVVDAFGDERVADETLNIANQIMKREASRIGIEYSFIPRKEYAGKLQAV